MTTIFILTYILVNLILIIGFYKILIKQKALGLALIVLSEYVLIWLNAELFNRINQYLSKNEIYIELGHSSLLLILLMMSVFGLATIVILFRSSGLFNSNSILGVGI
jgi:hypothetical protein